MKIIPHNQRPDWFYGPTTVPQELRGVPGIALQNSRIVLHLSHLSLLRLQEEYQPNIHFDRKSFDANTKQVGDFLLRPYQHEAREYILGRRGTLLADQMRLGKTASSLSAHDPKDGPLIIVAPLATRLVWLEWMDRFWPGCNPSILRGRKYDPSLITNPEFIFMNYDIALTWQNLGFKGVGTIIYDEGHLLQNTRSKRYQAACILGHSAKRVILASGTPLWNKPKGLWSILNLITPGAFGTFSDFGRRYCDPIVGEYGTAYDGVSNTEELRERLKPILLRRMWSDVAMDLPDVERTVEIAELKEKQLFQLEKAYERIRPHNKKSIAVGAMARYRRLLANHKAPIALDIAKRIMDSGEPVVVWTYHKYIAYDLAQKLNSEGYKAFAITGSDSDSTRTANQESWKQEKVGALVTTIAAANVGLDFSHARQAVFCEVDWIPANVAQAEMRTFHSSRPMSITYIAVDHEIDRRMISALKHKCDTALKLGIPASDTTVDVIAKAFDMDPDDADLNRLMNAFLIGTEGD